MRDSKAAAAAALLLGACVASPTPSPTVVRFELQTDLGAVNYAECDARCSDLGGQMPCVTRASVHAQLLDVANVANENVWLGYNDQASEGAWEWEHGCNAAQLCKRQG